MLFRSYMKVNNLIDELDSQSILQIRENLLKVATDEGSTFGKKFVARYVGNDEVANKLFTKFESAGASTGKLTLAQLDSYAKGFALDSTKDLFYNAAEKSNFADILRVVVPFGSAWSEVMTKWMKLTASNPEALRRVGVSVQGLRNADPDGDGKGFFWKDPQTGEYVFNYPFSKELGPLASYFGGMGALGGAVFGGAKGALSGGALGGLAGVGLQQALNVPGVNLIAPAKSLNMGLNI